MYIVHNYSILDITLILAKLGFISIRPLYTLYTCIQCTTYNVYTIQKCFVKVSSEAP